MSAYETLQTEANPMNQPARTYSPFVSYFRVNAIRERNPELFRTKKAIYYFIDQHADELQACGAIIRLGKSHRAPVLVSEEVLLEKCKVWADR